MWCGIPHVICHGQEQESVEAGDSDTELEINRLQRVIGFWHLWSLGCESSSKDLEVRNHHLDTEMALAFVRCHMNCGCVVLRWCVCFHPWGGRDFSPYDSDVVFSRDLGASACFGLLLLVHMEFHRCLGGGFKDVFFFNPIWGNDPI